jgi:hypothetical protein
MLLLHALIEEAFASNPVLLNETIKLKNDAVKISANANAAFSIIKTQVSNATLLDGFNNFEEFAVIGAVAETSAKNAIKQFDELNTIFAKFSGNTTTASIAIDEYERYVANVSNVSINDIAKTKNAKKVLDNSIKEAQSMRNEFNAKYDSIILSGKSVETAAKALTDSQIVVAFNQDQLLKYKKEVNVILKKIDAIIEKATLAKDTLIKRFKTQRNAVAKEENEIDRLIKITVLHVQTIKNKLKNTNASLITLAAKRAIALTNKNMASELSIKIDAIISRRASIIDPFTDMQIPGCNIFSNALYLILIMLAIILIALLAWSIYTKRNILSPVYSSATIIKNKLMR